MVLGAVDGLLGHAERSGDSGSSVPSDFCLCADITRMREGWDVRYNLSWIVRANDARIVPWLGTWGS